MDVEWIEAIGIDREFMIIALRLSIVAILSGLIGLEREIKNQPAGLRTHLLVGIGSCLMMLLSIFGFDSYLYGTSNVRFDPARIPSYVISGIGFLGAGTILVKGATIRGLTTAASIWVVSGLGLVVGAGMYAPAIFTTIMVVASLFLLNKLESRWLRSKSRQMLHVVVQDEQEILSEVIECVQENKMKLIHFKAEKVKEKTGKYIKYSLELELKDNNSKVKLIENLSKLEGVHRIF